MKDNLFLIHHFAFIVHHLSFILFILSIHVNFSSG